MKQFKFLNIFFIIAFCCSCIDYNITDVVHQMSGKTMEIPKNIVFINNALDTLTYSIEAKNKILVYYDSIGCLSCKLRFAEWQKLFDEIKQFTDKFVIILIVNPKNRSDIFNVKAKMREGRFSYPVCIDSSDEFNRLNHFPEDDRFRCFLLDENNRVVLIGNPVQNPKIKDLYIRTICERLNIDYKAEKQSNPRIHLGTISKNEAKTVQFEIKNSEKEVLKIDSVFTSCECTTAQVDKTQIQKNESAILTVTYFPDGTGDFYREIYVKIHDEINPRIFEIDGKIE